MALTVNDSTTYLAPGVNNVLEQTFLRKAKPLCPYFLGTKAGELMRHKSTGTVKWNRMENLTPSTTALTEVTTAAYMQGRTPATLTITPVTATPAKYGAFVIVNEEADLKNYSTQMDEIVQTIGIMYGRSANQLQRNEAEDNLTLIYPGTGASDADVGTTISLAMMKNVINTLAKNSAETFSPMSNGSTIVGSSPINEAYIGLCHFDVAVDIAQIAGFKSVETYAGHTSTYKGEFGLVSVAGKAVRFIASEDATVDADQGSGTVTGVNGDSACDLYTTVIYGKDCLGSVGFGAMFDDGSFQAGDSLSAVDVLIKTMGSGGTSDPLSEIMTVGYKFWHASALLNSNWGRGLRTAATLLQ